MSHFVHCSAAPHVQSSQFSWPNNGLIDIKETKYTYIYNKTLPRMPPYWHTAHTRPEPQSLLLLLLFSHWTFWIPNWCGHRKWYGQTNLSHWESHLNCLLTDGNCWCFDTTQFGHRCWLPQNVCKYPVEHCTRHTVQVVHIILHKMLSTMHANNIESNIFMNLPFFIGTSSSFWVVRPLWVMQCINHSIASYETLAHTHSRRRVIN